MKTKTLVGTATFNKLGNDMFWEYLFHDNQYNFYRAKWQGYDDAYWWAEVEPTDRIRAIEVEGNTKVFEINHNTNEVYLLEEVDEAN